MKLVAFHHAGYSSARHGSTESMRWPFKAWGADIVFAGHDHVYERFEVEGVPHITSGLGGNSTYGFSGTMAGSQVRFNDDNGAVLVTVTAGQALVEFWSVAGVRIDQRVVRKDCL